MFFSGCLFWVEEKPCVLSQVLLVVGSSATLGVLALFLFNFVILSVSRLAASFIFLIKS